MKNWIKISIIGLLIIVIGGMYYFKNAHTPKTLKANDYIYTSMEDINEALPTLMMLSTTT
jgi:uncharacterized protein YxeA